MRDKRKAVKFTAFALIAGVILTGSAGADQFSVGKDPIELWRTEVSSAKESVSVAIFKFSDKSALEALVAAHKRGVKVRLLVDGKEATAKKSLVSNARDAGIETIIWKTDSLGELHSKFTVIDSATLIAGSFNLSKGAAKNNTESFIIIHDRQLVEQASLAFADLITKATNP